MHSNAKTGNWIDDSKYDLETSLAADAQYAAVKDRGIINLNCASWSLWAIWDWEIGMLFNGTQQGNLNTSIWLDDFDWKEWRFCSCI